jgi:hypothetical protein
MIKLDKCFEERVARGLLNIGKHDETRKNCLEH